MLAIHLYREIYESGFKPNKQDHVTPVLATALKDQVNSPAKGEASSEVSANSCQEYCMLDIACGGISMVGLEVGEYKEGQGRWRRGLCVLHLARTPGPV